jgi:hypothetical protein
MPGLPHGSGCRNLRPIVYRPCRRAPGHAAERSDSARSTRSAGGETESDCRDAPARHSQSSTKERAEPKQRTRRGKLERVRNDREEVLKLDRATLPPNAQLKGHEDAAVQVPRVGADNVNFARRSMTPFYGPNRSGAAARWLPRRIRWIGFCRLVAPPGTRTLAQRAPTFRRQPPGPTRSSTRRIATDIHS